MAAGTTIAVVGNPNSGKTTLFNAMTGHDQRVGNWPGVTVERKEGRVQLDGRPVTIVDLPGVYALLAASEDERVARDYILSGEPGLVVDIVDASNLERNLFLTTQLIDLRVPLVVVLNMMDRAVGDGLAIDPDRLSRRLGGPVVAISATDRRDAARVTETVARAWAGRHEADLRPIPQVPAVEALAAAWAERLDGVAGRLGTISRWLALNLLERDGLAIRRVAEAGVMTAAEIEAETAALEARIGESADIALAEARYRFVETVTRDCLVRPAGGATTGDRIDRLVLNRVLGLPIFLGIMYVLFWFSISVGGAFIDVFDLASGAIFVDGFAALLRGAGSPEGLVTILAYGIGAGVQTVTTFIPVIFVMFLGLAVLEDSGYMARAAFVMDRFMRWLGLPGKSFVPLLIGFGCNVPAIMATRTLDSRRDRYLTIFMNPFMSCGARLPVYALFGAAFFGAAAGGMTFSLYAVGIVVAILTGLLLKRTLFRGEPAYFIMELPPYHRPRLGGTLRQSSQRLRVFMGRGRYIVPIVAILAVLNSAGTDGTFGNQDTPKSVLSSIGRTITPVFEPMGVHGDNWPATVGIFSGILAKETVVGTLNALYSQNGAPAAPGEVAAFDLGASLVAAVATIPANLTELPGKLADPFGFGLIGGSEVSGGSGASGAAAGPAAGAAGSSVMAGLRGGFTEGQPQAYAYLLFVLLYLPCVATFGAMTREMGLRYTFLAVGHIAAVSWSISTLFYQLTVGREPLWIGVASALLIGVVVTFWLIGERSRSREASTSSLVELPQAAG
ncbi:MAG: Fe(2+) transporter permease subunit FeoB [Chloroflexi bacterium]|nr:Fe(2+) transporter permease subunit FeoB [Chloroflexota bacterium]